MWQKTSRMTANLHINAGAAYSGTKPLCYSIEKTGYAPMGEDRKTEPNLLYYLSLQESEAQWYWESQHSHRTQSYIKKNYTLSDYIEYVKNRNGLLDFSNSNQALPDYFLKDIAPILQEEFNVTVTLIWRDPVRRSYSQLSDIYQKKTGKKQTPQWKIHKTSNLKKDLAERRKWREVSEKFPTSISFWKHCVENRDWHICDYAEIYKRWQCFDNVQHLIMEDLWSCDSELLLLEELLDCPVGVLYDNAYCSAGIAEGHQQTDLEVLSEEDIAWGRDQMSWVYNNFKDSFGYIPSSW